MNFSEEYKIAAQSLNPDSEALARMKANVLKKIAEGENTAATAQEKPKNSIPLTRRIALFGGSAAACAVIALSAVKLVPIFTQSNKIVGADTMGAETDNNAEIEISDGEVNADAGAYSIESANAAEDGDVGEKQMDTAVVAGGQNGDFDGIYDGAFEDSTEMAVEEEDEVEDAQEGADNSYVLTEPVTQVPDNTQVPENMEVPENEDVPIIEEVSENGDITDSTANSNDSSAYTEDVTDDCIDEAVEESADDDFEDITAEAVTEEMTLESCDDTDEMYDWETEESVIDITPNEGGVEALMFGENYVSTVISISEDNATIWVYGDGDHNSKGRYVLISEQSIGASDLPSVVLLNETDGEQYLVQLEKGRPNCIYVYDSSGRLLGKYKKNA